MGRKNKDFDFNILTSGYAAKVKVLDQNLYLTNRVHSYDTNQVHVETFGSNWILAFAKDIPLGKIAIRSNKNILPLEGNIAILIPPFFIAEWHIKKGPFSWYSLSSSNELKESLQQQASVFKWNPNQDSPANWTELNQFLTSSEPLFRVPNGIGNSNTALLTKKIIDQNYKSDLKISDISKQIKLNRIFISREFKKCFNISPVEYRHQLRIYEALKLMNHGASVTEAIFQSGYSSINQFISYFKKYFYTTPSQYHFKRPKQTKAWIETSP
jgi:AraC-like DNA-binding protein